MIRDFIEEMEIGDEMIRCMDTIKVKQRVYNYAYRTGKQFKITNRKDEEGRNNGILITRVD